MTAPPQKCFVYKFRKLASSIFQKAPYDSCAIYGFCFINENVPKKKLFFSILRGQLSMNVFFSHLIYISIANIRKNCTSMFRIGLKFK